MSSLPSRTGVAIVGSGFSGIGLGVRLRAAGITDFVILERAGDLGGTWRDNSYPGCACDVPSHLYSFSFALNPDWTSTFSPQAEIWDYLRRVSDRAGVTPHIRYGAELTSASWNESTSRWEIETPRGRVEARMLVVAAGGLSDPKVPSLPGLERFKGATFHSATWDHEHRLDGERVAVVGTGASAIQFIPEIQPLVGRLHVFQRTAPWIMPRRARPITAVEHRLYRWFPPAQRLVRAAICWGRETYAIPLLRVTMAPFTTRLAKRFMRSQVPDRELRRKLTPTYAPGCKRILISNNYLPALSQPNVELVTDGIREVRERSIVTADGREREVDTIIFGTGFQVTDFPIAHRLRAGGRSLAETWAEHGMQAHKGTAVAGFPNMFLLLGPNTGLGHTSVVLMSEAQVAYVMGAVCATQARGESVLEVRQEAQDAWNEFVQRKLQGTVWNAGGCKSWYLDAKGRNTTIWPDFTFRFRRILARFDDESYHWRPAAPAETPGTQAPAVVGA